MGIIFGILIGIAYLAVASWTFGFMRGATEDKTGFDTPLPLFSSALWPITLLLIALKTLVVPLQSLGLSMQQKKVESKRQRIELQQKTRIELEQIEKELEEEFQLLEEVEDSVEKKRSRKRATSKK